MKKIFLFLISTLFSVCLFAEYNRFNIPDSAEIRPLLIERWFEAPLSSLRFNVPEIYANKIGNKFQVRMEENDETFNVFVSPETMLNVRVYSDKGFTIQEQAVYPGDIQGSWVLVRDKKTEKPLRIRYYFLKDSDVYIQFTPYNRTTLVDLVIFDNYAAKGVSAGVPFEKFYTASIQDVYDLTQKIIPWDYVTVNSEDYQNILQMAGVIQEKLPQITFLPDAMYDESNELVHISTGEPFVEYDEKEGYWALSSAGFLKWVADGLVEPMAGGRLKRKPLIQETISVKETGRQGVLSQKYSLFFGLDWIRNLSSAVLSVFTGIQYLFNQSGVDVKINPFSVGITKDGVKNPVTFIEDTGYNIAVLKSLLYVLAATEPGTFYFGAIRETDKTVIPEIKVFNQNVVFMPYFNSDGSFNCYVFMNGRELSLEDFCMIYGSDFVYLTKVKSSREFFPQ